MNSPAEDYYTILGVARNADAKTIKNNFRELAMKYHPDRCKEPNAEEKFKKITEAYAVLSDPNKKALYDSNKEVKFDTSNTDFFRGVDWGNDWGFDFNESFIDRIFGGLFGRPISARQNKGEDIGLILEVSLEKIAKGGEEPFRYSHSVLCPSCQGSGAAPGTSPQTCKSCNGSGRKICHEIRNGISFQQIASCPDCAGRGSIITKTCSQCEGKGQYIKFEELKVKIPAGTVDGTVLRIAGHGTPSPSLTKGRPGDLLLYIQTQYNPHFAREGRNLKCKASITIAEAVLGTKLNLSTLDGSVEIKIPPGTQPNTVFCLRGKGLPNPSGGANGDLLVEINVQIPKNISDHTCMKLSKY